MPSQLQQKYNNTIRSELHKEFNLKSVMQIPKIEKIVVNMGVGDATKDAKLLESAINELKVITGQNPTVTKAKKSIATFKLREGQAIGCKVTLRGDKMWSFLERLINVALPRVRDFRGLSPRSFDSQANYTIGVKEQIIFPEIVYDDVKKIRGFDVTLVTSTTDKTQALRLLTLLGLPLIKQKEQR
ncbi:50S ribosomal protein L5 [[Mycoplasma] testudinis]|uniref:50S ribosomal protein L5 n=1 Tax=[Mycoplasma] testudinis TaxID=33924 RepID=UPI000484FF98|nr:50S ribosomal protein L5 [[Mycoplasma] testudinis]